MATVETRSRWHMEMRPVWDKCRAAVSGDVAVYLPPIAGMSDAEREGYIARALYFNATQRTHDALVGMVMMRPPMAEIPDGMRDVVEYIDGRGARLEDFARLALSEVLEVGGGLALVDHPERPEGVVTASQERALGLQPRAAWYPLESVLEYRMGIVAGNEEITFLKLSETYSEESDEWTIAEREQIRVYDMAEGRVRVRVFRKGPTGEWAVYSEAYPSGRTGIGLTYIPAVFFGPIKNTPGKPPLIDLIEVNLSHYRNSADREHALHFTGLPTPYATGVDPTTLSALTLGSSLGYVFENDSAQIRFATYDAAGLGAVKEAMDDKVQQMAALGARMLAPESARAESGHALAIRREGENSALAKVADSVSRSIVLVLETIAEWTGVQGEISYSMNTDYLPQNLDAATLTAIVGAWQNGAITWVDLFDRLRVGGVIRDDKTIEEHEADMLTGPDTDL